MLKPTPRKALLRFADAIRAQQATGAHLGDSFFFANLTAALLGAGEVSESRPDASKALRFCRTIGRTMVAGRIISSHGHGKADASGALIGRGRGRIPRGHRDARGSKKHVSMNYVRQRNLQSWGAGMLQTVIAGCC